MASRRPIVLVNGRKKELPTADTLIGVPLKLPVGTAAGVVYLPLSSTYTLTIGLRAGGTFNVQATT
jgi:hypothetical protein